MNLILKKRGVLPGFGLAFGITVVYLSLVVIIPLGALVLKTTSLGWSEFLDTVTAPRVVASYRLTLTAAFISSLFNLFFGTTTAWVLVRYSFPGKKIVDALIDLPFALPTAVAGITLTTLYSGKGWFGVYLEPWGIKVAYAPLGIYVALTFIGLPFVVRMVQPVLADLDPQIEEAAASLGADRRQTFYRVILPSIFPAAVTGFALAFARSLGEYGSVIFIAGNMPMVSEITPLLIITKLEQFDYAGATAIAVVMLSISFVIMLAINMVQRWSRKKD